MDKMHLIMVLHSHQPVGNFDWVMKMATERCYRPVMEILNRYPSFRLGLHFTGPLLNWLKNNDAALLAMVLKMVNRNQVELLSGGYYEPLLASIPKEDAVAQVDKLTSRLEMGSKKRPTGFWLAERIWEPGLPAKIADCNLQYTIVDDTHFYYAGLPPQAMFGYHLTEREGHPLALFPSHKTMRYLLPFKEPWETLDFLKRTMDEQGPTAATYGDDTEKFGLWPGTHKWVLEKGWLIRFIEAILKESSWLDTCGPGEYMANHPPRGRVYPPTASYEEMLTWALPTQAAVQMEEIVHELKDRGEYERYQRFVRGGMWDNFLVKYRASNLMHKRALYVSQKLREGEGRQEQAHDHLFQAQCNCAYWHGLFGGIYLCHLRQAIHEHLIAADSMVDEELGKKWAYTRELDLDKDGYAEVILAVPDMDVLIHPAYGGQISLLNLRPQRFNPADVLTRQPEIYHNQVHIQAQMEAESLAPHGCGGQISAGEDDDDEAPKSAHDVLVFKEPGLEKHLHYDWYQRGVFQDHFLPPSADLPAYLTSHYHEWGDFLDKPYELKEHGRDRQQVFCHLERQGHIWAPGGPWPLTIKKSYTLQPGQKLECAYLIACDQQNMPALRFGVEFNLTMLAATDPNKYLYVCNQHTLGLAESHATPQVQELAMVNRNDGFALNIQASKSGTLWHFPVEAINQSEAGLERTYQGSSLTLIFDIPAGPGEYEVSLNLAVESLK